MTALNMAVITTIGMNTMMNPSRVAYFERICGATATIASTANVNPLTRVTRKVVAVGASFVLFLRSP